MFPLPAKRKRTQISYAELEDETSDFAYDSNDYVAMNGFEDDDLIDGDTAYGVRRKPGKTNKSKANKRAKSSPAKPKKQTKPFLFMMLPGELRDYIYELALTEKGGLTLISKTKAFRRTITRGTIYEDEKAKTEINQLSPNILAVNKQINSEAIGYLYKQPLVLEDTTALHTFVAAIGPSNRLRVIDLIVSGWGSGRGVHKAMNVAALTILAGCTNLKSFRLNCIIGWHRAPKHLARQLYRDGHYFLEAYGAANGRRDAAVDILQLNKHNYSRRYMYHNASLGDEEYKEYFQEELRKLLGYS